MALKVQTFERNVRVVQAFLSPEGQRQQLANFARSELGRVIGAGLASPSYRRFVNGRADVSEYAVQLPGPILYQFTPLNEAVDYAIEFLRARYPVVGPAERGHYRDSFIIMVDGRVWTRGKDIPHGSEVVIVNTQPYSRKVAVGARGFRLSKGLMENTRQALFRRWPGMLECQIRFITLSDGYILKGKRPDVAAKQNRKSSAFRAGVALLAKRKDTDAGQPLKYPALVISASGD